MDRIEQIKVSNGVKFFKEPMMNRWGLKDYHDVNAPCLFFNVNDQEDIDAVKNHRGFKLILFVNARGNQVIDNFIGIRDLAVINNVFLNVPISMNTKTLLIEIQDYSMFKPNLLGDKVYCYVGSKDAMMKFGWGKAIRVQRMIDYDIIFGMHPNSLDKIKREFYDNCFINLNLEETGGGGMNTSVELGRMGRYTISNSHNAFPNLIKYKDMNELVDIINRESKKIGTVQPSIDFHTMKTDEWLNINYWI